MKIKKIYKAAPGASYNNIQANVIGKRLEQLGINNYKDINPEIIVTDAKKEKSPLHLFFNWDDTEAAKAYRLGQARNIVNHLRVVIITGDQNVETKAFHSITIENNSNEAIKVYRPVLSMAGPNEEEVRNQVLEIATREIQSWRMRYSEYTNVFGDVFKEIDKLLSNVQAA